MSLINLGQSLINKTTKIKFRILSQIDDLKSNFKLSCPTRDKMLAIIKRRNDLVNILNQLKRNIITIDNTTKPLIPLLTILTTTITTLKLLPAPTSLPGVTVGAIITVGDTLNIINTQLNNFTNQLNAFELIKNYILLTINSLITSLQSLDLLINNCLNDPNSNTNQSNSNNQNNTLNNQVGNNNNNGIIQNNSNNVNNLGVTLTTVDLINSGLNQNGDNFLIQQLQSNTLNQYNSYNGFKFEIKTDLTSTSRFPKRYAVAKNSSGIILLRGESSFSSSVKILIDELKFQIDSAGLKAF